MSESQPPNPPIESPGAPAAPVPTDRQQHVEPPEKAPTQEQALGSVDPGRKVPGRKHLDVHERQRIRTLFNDAKLTKDRIAAITGHSRSQIRTAIRAPSAQPAHRAGRPRTSLNPKAPRKSPPPGSKPSTRKLTAVENYIPPNSLHAASRHPLPASQPQHQEEQELEQEQDVTMSEATTLPPWKQQFLEASINGKILKFGSFELKSKRISPYFFNAGDFFRADLLRAISTAYAHTIIEATKADNLKFDIVFGPAYKGIPFATATVDKLAQIDEATWGHMCYSFDRKEAKDHGEGGNIVGAPLKGKRVLIIDDVITAGTAKREAITKIRAEGGEVAGIVVALDRMEKLPSPDGDDAKPMPSAMGELRKEYGIPIYSILTLDDIIAGVRGVVSDENIKQAEEYREKYKATD